MLSDEYSRLVSTNTWTFPKPAHNPGYKGYVPTLRHSFGETFGNATEKYFLDHRSKTLNKSCYPPRKGGSPVCELPEIYTDPRLVIGSRDRTQARWTEPTNYRVVNYSADLSNRNQEILYFNKELIQKHREVYNDKTGTKHHIPFFVLPGPNNVNKPRVITTDREPVQRYIAMPSVSSCGESGSNVRSRMMRDVHFEKR